MLSELCGQLVDGHRRGHRLRVCLHHFAYSDRLQNVDLLPTRQSNAMSCQAQVINTIRRKPFHQQDRDSCGKQDGEY